MATIKNTSMLDQCSNSEFLRSAQTAGLHQVEVLLESSVKVFELCQAISTSWLQRQTEDLQIGMEAAKRMSECQDISEATEIYSRWATESMSRLQDELAAVPAQITSLGEQSVAMIQGMTNVAPAAVAPTVPTAIRRVA